MRLVPIEKWTIEVRHEGKAIKLSKIKKFEPSQGTEARRAIRAAARRRKNRRGWR